MNGFQQQYSLLDEFSVHLGHLAAVCLRPFHLYAAHVAVASYYLGGSRWRPWNECA